MQRLRGRAACFLLAACALGASPALGGTSDVAAVASATLSADSWQDDSYFVLGDTQGLSDDATRAQDYAKITEWVCTNRAAYDIVGVVTVGDNVQDGGNLTHFSNIDPAFDNLDNCQIPYIAAYGNHDGSPVATLTSDAQNATNYQQQLMDRMRTKWWFKGSGDYTLGIYTTNLQARSFWADMAGPIAWVAGEWGAGYDNSTNFDTADVWIRGRIQNFNAQKRMVMLSTHENPCRTTPCSTILGGIEVDEWAAAFPALIGSVNGHYNALSCAQGWGFFGTPTISGRTHSSFLVGGIDHSCATRAYDATAYGWNVLVQWHRASRRLCMRSIRVINASTTPATVLGTPDFDRAVNSNSPETCVEVPPL